MIQVATVSYKARLVRPDTANSHMRAIVSKVGASDRTQADGHFWVPSPGSLGPAPQSVGAVSV